MKNIYTVGIGKIDITPPLTVPYLGFYPNRLSYFKGIHDRLYARTLYLNDGNVEILIISADMIGISDALLGRNNSFVAQLKKMIGVQTGIPADHILLAATHAHSTPETIDVRPVADLVPDFKPWLKTLMEQISSSARTAQSDCFSARLLVKKSSVTGLSKNRDGNESLDNELTVLDFESKEGKKALLVNFACHPVIVQVQPMISADYPGALTRIVEESLPPGSLCLFLQGACGDINPFHDDTRNFDDVEKTGSALAEEVKLLSLRFNPMEVQPEVGVGSDRRKTTSATESFIKPEIRVVTRTLAFKSCRLPNQDETTRIEHEVADLEQQLAVGNCAKSVTVRLALLHEILSRIRQGDEDRPAFLQLIRIGNAVLFTMPLEPGCLLGRQLKQMAVPLTGVPVGYANGFLGYVLEPSIRKEGYGISCGPSNQLDQQAFNLTKEHFLKMLAEL